MSCGHEESCGHLSISLPVVWAELVGEASFPVKDWHRDKKQNWDLNQLRIDGRYFDCGHGL